MSTDYFSSTSRRLVRFSMFPLKDLIFTFHLLEEHHHQPYLDQCESEIIRRIAQGAVISFETASPPPLIDEAAPAWLKTNLKFVFSEQFRRWGRGAVVQEPT